MTPKLALTALIASSTVSVLSPSLLSAQAAAPAEQNVALQQIDPDEAVLVLVDYTSGLYPVVDTIETDEMLNNAVAAGKIAQTFGVPILVLGDEGGFYGEMHPPIKAMVEEGGEIHLRTTPSAWASGTFREALEATGRTQVIIGGISTDNCTLLTSLDLLRAGYDVYVMTDISGTDSRQSEEAAILRLRDAGASTVSWIMFGSELLGDWGDPEGAALGAIYAAHINGPNSGPLGNSIDSTEVGAAAASSD